MAISEKDKIKILKIEKKQKQKNDNKLRNKYNRDRKQWN